MIGTSKAELVFIRGAIFILNDSIELLGAGWGLSLTLRGPTIVTVILGSALALDITYCLTIWLPATRRLASIARHPPPLDPTARKVLFAKCHDNVPDVARYLRFWCLGSPLEEIKRDNLKSFFRWAFFDNDDQQADKDECDTLLESSSSEDVDDEELEGYINRTEKSLGQAILPGDGTARPLRLTFDNVKARYRSVFWYCIVGVVDMYSCARLQLNSFHHYSLPMSSFLGTFPPRPQTWLSKKSAAPKLSYWFRSKQNNVSAETLPIVFIHGIGIGLYPYIPFLSSLPRTSAIIAVELLPVSMHITSSDPLARQEFLENLRLILGEHGVDRFVVISHSYGTALTTYILRSDDLGPRCAGVILTDPISLLLHLPDVAYNFTRRIPRRANEWLLWYMASMDPSTALVLGRHFFWRECILWREELLSLNASKGQRKAAVCLSGADLIVDTKTVAQYLVDGGEAAQTEWWRLQSLQLDTLLQAATDTKLSPTDPQYRPGHVQTKDGIEILWFGKLDHAQIYDHDKDYGRVLEVVNRFVQPST